MITAITHHLAKNYYDLRIKSDIYGNKDGDYFFAESAIRRILTGEDPISKNGWLLSDEDLAWLNQEITLIHGKMYRVHSDVVHFCSKVYGHLDNGDIRPAQELIGKMAEASRVGMIVEMRHGA